MKQSYQLYFFNWYFIALWHSLQVMISDIRVCKVTCLLLLCFCTQSHQAWSNTQTTKYVLLQFEFKIQIFTWLEYLFWRKNKDSRLNFDVLTMLILYHWHLCWKSLYARSVVRNKTTVFFLIIYMLKIGCVLHYS